MRDPDPFGADIATGCECTGLAAGLQAMLNGDPQPLCPVHDAAEYRARETAAQVSKAEANLETVRAVRDELQAEHDAADIAASQAVIDRGVARRRKAADPFALHLADVAGAPADPAQWGGATPLNSPDLANRFARPDLAIGDDAGFVAILKDALGPGATFNEHPDQPLDAA